MTSIAPEYWPPIYEVARWYNSKAIQVQTYGTYQKQSFLNRCKVAGVQSVLTLSVPLVGGREQKRLLKEVEIDHSQQWSIQHLRTIQSCYGKAPFYDYYFPTIERLLVTASNSLVEFNQNILQQLISWLKWNGNISEAPNFTQPVENTAFIPLPYVQVFADRQPFQPNLSILDLLFCVGPSTKAYLQQLWQQNA